MREGLHDQEPDKASHQKSEATSSLELLLNALLADQGELLARLTAALGSRDMAQEMLHDVYLKLKSEPRIGEIRSPRAYLYRMAINLAKNKRRTESRFVSVDDVMITGVPDEAPDQERILLATDEMDRAVEFLRSLPPKRKAIFLARWRDEKTQVEIASEFGMHKRSVQKELDKAERFLKHKLGRPA